MPSDGDQPSLKLSNFGLTTPKGKHNWDEITLLPDSILLKNFTKGEEVLDAAELQAMKFNFGGNKWVVKIKTKDRQTHRLLVPLNIPNFPAPVLLIRKIAHFCQNHYQLKLKSNVPGLMSIPEGISPELEEQITTGEIHSHSQKEQNRLIRKSLPKGLRRFRFGLIICEVVAAILLLAVIVWQIVSL